MDAVVGCFVYTDEKHTDIASIDQLNADNVNRIGEQCRERGIVFVVATQQVAAPIAVVKGRVGDDVIGLQILVGVV